MRLSSLFLFLLLSVPPDDGDWKESFKNVLVDAVHDFASVGFEKRIKPFVTEPYGKIILSDPIWRCHSGDEDVLMDLTLADIIGPTIPIYQLDSNAIMKSDSLSHVIDFKKDARNQIAFIKTTFEEFPGTNVHMFVYQEGIVEQRIKKYVSKPMGEYFYRIDPYLGYTPLTHVFLDRLNSFMQKHPDMELFRINRLNDLWGLEYGKVYHVTSNGREVVAQDGQAVYEALLKRYGKNELLRLSEDVDPLCHEMQVDNIELYNRRLRREAKKYHRKMCRDSGKKVRDTIFTLSLIETL